MIVLEKCHSLDTLLQVGLRAKLSALERFEYIVKFVITIRDENDNSPVFATALEKPLPEDSPIGVYTGLYSPHFTG